MRPTYPRVCHSAVSCRVIPHHAIIPSSCHAIILVLFLSYHAIMLSYHPTIMPCQCLWSAMSHYPSREAMITDACVPLSRLPDLIALTRTEIDASFLPAPVHSQ